ncbi:hypothetical protein ACFLZ6_00615, partial [Nanoarchaeota archaeon]
MRHSPHTRQAGQRGRRDIARLDKVRYTRNYSPNRHNKGRSHIPKAQSQDPLPRRTRILDASGNIARKVNGNKIWTPDKKIVRPYDDKVVSPTVSPGVYAGIGFNVAAAFLIYLLSGCTSNFTDTAGSKGRLLVPHYGTVTHTETTTTQGLAGKDTTETTSNAFGAKGVYKRGDSKVEVEVSGTESGNTGEERIYNETTG